MSSYDGENGDSLDIKPPQAQTGGSQEKKEKRSKRERHHRHKGESGHRHKRESHRSRSDHRGSEHHSKERRRHREGEERSESSSRRRKERVSGRSTHLDAAAEFDGRSKPSERHSRPTKRDISGHRRGGQDRSGSRQQAQLADADTYYNMHDGGRSNISPLLPDPVPMHLHHHHHHQQQQYFMHQNDHYHSSTQHHRSRGGGLQPSALPSREMNEREKRMERMMAAEKQKEQSQREAESRRQRKEEGKRLDADDFLHSSVQDSPQDNSPEQPSSSPSRPHKRKKLRKDVPEEEVHIISENEEEENKNEEQQDAPVHSPQPGIDEEAAKEAKASDGSDSDSSDSSSDSDSDSDSSDSDEESGAKKSKAEDGEAEAVNGAAKGHRSGSSTPSKEGRFDDSPRRGGLSDVSSASGEVVRSPTRSPVPMKEVLPSYYPAIMGCRSVDEFECLNRIAEGTYGVVYRAREKCNGTIVALKRLKMEKEKEGFPITSLREINTLLKGQHCNIVTVREIVVGSNMDKIYIVMDYVEHDLKSLMETMSKKKQSFSLGEVKTLMLQLLRAVHHLHDNWILHRDLKTSNLLLSHTGILKVGDFGLAREYGSPLKQYTPIVVTLWYRAPELLLGTKLYSTAIDVWSVGCIFGELLAMEPFFPGKSEIDQLNRIFKELGTPSDAIWPGYSQLPVVKRTQFTEFPYNHLRERFKERLSDKGFLLMNKFLTYDPQKRITSHEALQHDYFHAEPPAPIPPAMFPTWPAKSENPNGIAAVEDPNRPPNPPSGGKNFKDLGDDDHGVPGFFLGGGQQAGAGFTLKF
ncbi:cyclin-dependent kinase 11B isoform X2 [Hyalella azteca]|uniref:cyclin-dependent kinase n=1 Tax=Hyalella azteca TaxID=294128 RepID=A0A8B7NM68_HYAAZ|nr:cyclin-dependent kinase 11B isoform X2 [Hyalella azteca]